MYFKKVNLPTLVGGNNDKSRIPSLFRGKYKSLLNNHDSHGGSNVRSCHVVTEDSPGKHIMAREFDCAIDN